MDHLHTGAREEYPLSLSQQNIWDVECACPDTSINHICTTLHIQGRVDFSALQRSVSLVLRADGSLRARIVPGEKYPMQYQAPYCPEQIPVYDFSQTSPEGIESWEEAFTRERMPLWDAPLYRFVLLRTGENSGGLVVKMHHLISDGWTQVLLCNRIGQAYLDLLAGAEPQLPPAASYQDHIDQEQRYLASPAYAKDQAYWRQVLQQSGEPSLLKVVRGAAVSPVGRRLTFALPQDLNHDISRFCMGHRVSPFSVFYMALAIYFKRIGGADRFTIGVPIFNRASFADKQTSGMFVSTLPFFSQISGDWSLEQFHEHLNEGWFDMLRHQRFPFAHIQRLSQGQGDAARLFHIAFSYQNSQLLKSGDASVLFAGRWHYSGYQLEQLCIHLSNLEDNRRFCVDYDYLTQFFSAEEIQTLHACLVNILREALSAPQRPIRQLAVLSPQERERVVYTFNRTQRPIYEDSLYGRFLRGVQRHPDRAALICAGERTPYRQLELLSQRFHAALESICAAPDTLVAVLLPRRPELFGAMLGILRAGGAFMLLSPDQPDNRIREILTQSGAAALVSTPQAAGRLGLSLPLVDVDCLPQPTAAAPVQVPPEGLAYVVYTSGSTGAPKGVEIPRRALLNLCCAMEPIYGKGAVLSVCSVGFDAFLLESAAALLNARTVILPQEEQLESPRSLAGLMTGYGAGFLSTTPSRLAAYLKDGAFQRAAAGLECIVCGGEAFPSGLLQRLQLDTRARIYNQYGPSETAVAVSLKKLNGCPAITAGAPMQNCRLYVLDNWGNPLPIGVYGNLYVGGACVGRGYRNAPQLTAQSFQDSPFELGERLYRTGDLACWTPQGEIVLSGRSDRQVKLRGLRVEPQEVSACLARHPRVKQAAAVVQRHGGQEVLVAFYTCDAPIPQEELLGLCADFLPHYMIPSALLPVAEIPLTPNGKVDEAHLPTPQPDAPAPHRPGTGPQELLLSILRRVLNRPDLGLDGDYFLFGGNSLNAMEALGEIAQATGVTLRVADLYTLRTPRRLAGLLDRGEAAPAAHLTPAPRQEYWPLTPIQQGIYVQTHLDPTGRTYHMAGAFRLPSPPDVPRLEGAFRRLIAQEPLLRTAFVPRPEGIFAQVWDRAEFALPVSAGATLEQAAAPLLAPFQLDRPPLLRAALWEQEPGQWVLLLNVHHLVGDGLTTQVLLSRLDGFYTGRPPQAQPVSYLDYAWHLSRQEAARQALDYWRQALSPVPQPLELPGDFPRARSFDFQGRTCTHVLGRELSQACDRFCAQAGVTPYMLFLAAFGLLLSRVGGRQTLVVGAAASGRLLPETKTMCGPFLNTLPLRLDVGGALTVEAYLDQVRAQVSGMLDHQQTGLEDIARALSLPRTLSQSPLFQVIFSQRPLDAAAFTLDGAPLEYLPLPTGTARMDLWVELYRQGEQYAFQLEYATQLFLDETAAYLGRCLEAAAAALVRPGARALRTLDILSPRDRMELLDIPQNTVSPFLNLPIPAQFARQLALDPDAPAVVFHGRTTTRRELDRRACQIACVLSRAGAAPGCRVGIALSRGVDLVAAVLAIWKVGGAYAPLLAHYPRQRLAYMVEVAGISHILCDEKTAGQLPTDLPCAMVSTAGRGEDDFEPAPLKETDLAEVLFTSGSTGRPKGVMLVWRSIANMAAGFRDILRRSNGPILCTTNVVFDMFNGEVVIPLSMGKPIVMADEEEMMLPWKLAQLIRRDGVTITQSTPSRVQMWLSNEAFCQAAPNLELMIYGGEVLTQALLCKAQAASGRAVMVNMYGPTEGTVYNTTRQADCRGHINVGWPMQNNRVYILDADLHPVLPTAVGELYLAGECVSAGYISRPDLTQAAFLPDPFFPGERMYRTGDIARLRLDGSYDFLGRRDAQVKLNGQRVELDEINGALVSTGCALQAATVPVRREDGSMQLFTYYIPNPAQAADGPAIRAKLGQVLPAYMIPSRLEAVDAMPSTPTGKIDLRQLRERAQAGQDGGGETSAAPPPPVQEPNAAPVPPQAQSPDRTAPDGGSPLPPEQAAPAPRPASVLRTELVPGSLDWIVALWQRVLGRPDVDPDRSFFEQGGTSLAALSVLSHYNNQQLVLSLSQFYEHPTPQDQARLLCPRSAPAVQAAPPASPAQPLPPAPDLARTILVSPPGRPSRYPRQVPPLPAAPVRRPMDTVLLTGATGFFGAHLLRALLDAGAGQVVCLLRDADRTRLIDCLSWYFGSGWAAGLGSRVAVVQGDLARENLGLSPQDFGALAARVDAVWHCAADVRHYAADSQQLLRTNLDGTRALLALARQAAAPIYHMSTTSVSGDRLCGRDEGAVFTEEDFDIGQDWRQNLYVRSKFLAEDAVYEAVRAGLTARVFRLGRLVGRAQDGTFQRNPRSNAFWLTLRGIHFLGALPACMARTPLELTPVDWCAQAAVALRDVPMTTCHLLSPTPPTVEQAARVVAPQLQVVSDGEFELMLSRAPVDGQGDVLAPLIDLWNHLRQAPPTITVDCRLTEEALERAGLALSIPGPGRLLQAFCYDSGPQGAKRGAIHGI